MKSSPSVINNPYIIVDKPGQVINMAASASAATGTYSPTPQQSLLAHNESYHLYPKRCWSLGFCFIPLCSTSKNFWLAVIFVALQQCSGFSKDNEITFYLKFVASRMGRTLCESVRSEWWRQIKKYKFPLQFFFFILLALSLSHTHTFCALLFTMTHAVGLQAIIKASCHSDHITESLGVCGVCSWCNITVCVCVCGEQFHLHRCTTDVLLAYAVSPITAFWHNIFTAHTNLHTNTPTCSQGRWVCVGGQSSVLWF